MGLVQSAHGTATSGSTVAATFGSGTTAADTIIPMVNSLSIPTVRTVSSIALTGGADTFTKAVAVSVSDQDSEIWSDVGCSGGHTIVTATFSGTINDASIDIIEWNGITGAVDKTNSGSNASSGTWTSNATGTLSQTTEVAFGTMVATAVSAVTVTAPGSPWTNLGQDSPASTYVAQSGWQQTAATTSLTYNGTDTPSTASWTACIATFKLTVVATPAPFTVPQVALRGLAGRRGRVLGPGLLSRGAPYKPHKNLLISLASAAGIDDYGNSFPQGIFASAGVIEGPVLIGSNAFYYSPAPGLGNLTASVAAAAGTDQYGNAYVAGQTSYGGSGSNLFATSDQAGSLIFYTATSAGGPWNFYGQIEISLLTAGQLVLNFTSIGGVLAVPQAAVSGFPVSGSATLATVITALNNLYNMLGTAGVHS